MNNFFIKMLDQIVHDFPLHHSAMLLNGYLVADEEIRNIQFISNDMIKKIEENDLNDFFDLDYMLAIPEELKNIVNEYPQVFRLVKHNCEGIEIEVIKLDSFFESLYYDVEK